MSGQKQLDRESYWRSIFLDYDQSELSIRRFCIEKGISEGPFFAWRKKLGVTRSASKGEPAPSSDHSLGKVEVAALREKPQSSHSSPADEPSVPASGPSFVSLKLPLAEEPVEVVHPHGYVIRVGKGADLHWLGRLFQMLDQQAITRE